MPSSRKAKKAIVEKVPCASCTILELGSGWGGLAFSLGEAFPNAHIIAYEISLLPWLWSLLLKKIRRCENVKMIRKNFYDISFDQVDCVVCYLFPKAMRKLEKKFRNELKSGSVVISNSFSLQGWKPVEEADVKDFWNSKIYFYVKI